MEKYLEEAEKGNIRAQHFWGDICYKMGDKYEALNWYVKAAQSGDSNAKLKCGEMYYNGEGTNEDKQEALKWYLQAANNGECVVQFMCGQMYYNGEGTKKDKQEALKWFFKAAEQGHREAKLLCDKYSD